MAKLGRPPTPHPRAHGAFVRFSDTEWGAVVRAMVAEHPVIDRRPTAAEWIRDLAVAHASEVLGVEVTRAALRHAPGGVPDWKRWRIARAVRRAAPRRRDALGAPDLVRTSASGSRSLGVTELSPDVFTRITEEKNMTGTRTGTQVLHCPPNRGYAELIFLIVPRTVSPRSAP
jgi:hypothetical protein